MIIQEKTIVLYCDNTSKQHICKAFLKMLMIRDKCGASVVRMCDDLGAVICFSFSCSKVYYSKRGSLDFVPCILGKLASSTTISRQQTQA